MKTFKAMKRAFYKDVRRELLQAVLQCLPKEQRIFKLMYADSLEQPIEEVVKMMPCKKLDWAMQQIQNTFNGRVIGQVVMWRNDYCEPQYFDNQTIKTKDGSIGTWGETKVVLSEGIWSGK